MSFPEEYEIYVISRILPMECFAYRRNHYSDMEIGNVESI